MSAYTDIAAELQSGVMFSELDKLERGLGRDSELYSAAGVRQSIVHIRQDAVMLVSLLDSLNIQLRALRWTAFLILISLWVLHWWR